MFGCKACKAKDQQIAYLQSLVDRALVKNGMAPVLGKDAQDREQLEVDEVKETFNPAEEIQTFGGAG